TITLRRALRRLDWRPLRSLKPDDFVLLDGADLLGPLSWLRVRWCCRRAGGLVITSHRPGLLPTLLECETTPELLAEIVNELAGESTQVEELFARHRGNLRTALRDMYDGYASPSSLRGTGNNR
ncbi:MAG TPA: hypothetical protein VE078_07040, partial [Thermoanaerobaculia bacterium]|nr:hypothetical protein [Thermoanaerobaculia bacterium]